MFDMSLILCYIFSQVEVFDDGTNLDLVVALTFNNDITNYFNVNLFKGNLILFF